MSVTWSAGLSVVTLTADVLSKIPWQQVSNLVGLVFVHKMDVLAGRCPTISDDNIHILSTVADP